MTTSAQNSHRPIAVSSMSSLDSLIDAALDNKTDTLSDDYEQMQVPDSNVVSSSTLSSIGASPTLTSSTAPGKEVSTSANTTSVNSSAPTGMMLSASVPLVPAASARAPAATQAPAAPNSNTVAEFLFQLSKMLTDDNKEIIEWSNGTR